MNIFEVDTIKMRECGQSIIDISNELNELFDGLFSRISNMPIKTFEWVGDSANAFVKTSKIDKIQYLTFDNEIYKLGKFLVDNSYYIEQDISKVEK